jgi:hypothetical protein
MISMRAMRWTAILATCVSVVSLFWILTKPFDIDRFYTPSHLALMVRDVSGIVAATLCIAFAVRRSQAIRWTAILALCVSVLSFFWIARTAVEVW